MPELAVVVRFEGSRETVPELFESLRAQTLRPDEVVTIGFDGAPFGGQDLKLRNCAFETSEYVGAAMNAGMRETSAEIVVHIGSNSLPVGRHFLQAIGDGFADPGVAAVRCLNIANSAEIRSWMVRREADAATDYERSVLTGPNSACCAIRRSAWSENAFAENVTVSEDKIWARGAIRQGQRLASCEAIYIRKNAETWWAAIKRLNRQTLEFYLATGTLVSHNPPTAIQTARRILVGAPLAAVRVALTAICTYLALAVVPAQAWFRRRSNPIGERRQTSHV
jgi:hypothetical protein